MSMPATVAMRPSRSRDASFLVSLSERYLAPLGIYLLILLAATPLDRGDTIYFVNEIQGFLDRPDSAAWQTFLEFGHLLWRPLGWAGFRIAAFLHPVSGEQERVMLTSILIGFSMVAGAIATLLMFSLFRRFRLPYVPSLIAIAVFAGGNAVLNTSQSGMPYAASLAALTAALWMVIVPDDFTRTRAWIAGALVALSTALWLPFVLAAGAIALASAVRWSPVQTRRPVLVACSAAAFGLIFFGTAAFLLRATSVHQVAELLQGAGHGWRQTKTFLRAGTGLPRCCMALGDDGVLWKRFLFHDPYVPVTLRQVLLATLPKLAVFYGGLLLLAVTLARTLQGRRLLCLALAALLPVLFFAVFLFEPSSIERFMPVLPFFCLAIACQLSFVWTRASLRTISLVLPALILYTSVGSHLNARVNAQWDATVQRLQPLEQVAPAGSTVILLDNADPILVFLNNSPLHPAYPASFNFWVAVRLANERIFRWREGFAARVDAAWKGPGEIWISARVLAPNPAPEWGWVEGDDAAIHWRDLPAFFGGFEYDRKAGGADGFLRFAPSQRNRDRIAALNRTSR